MPSQRVQQLAQRHLRLAAQDEVQGGEGAHRLQRERRDVRAEGDGARAQGLGQEDAVHVVAQGGRGDLGQVVLGPLLLQQLLELGPAHAQGDAVDDLHRVVGQQDGGQLRQAHLRPDHVLAAAPAHAVLAADPDAAVGGRRVDEQDVHAARGPGARASAVCTGRAGVREARRGQRRDAPRSRGWRVPPVSARRCQATSLTPDHTTRLRMDHQPNDWTQTCGVGDN